MLYFKGVLPDWWAKRKELCNLRALSSPIYLITQCTHKERFHLISILTWCWFNVKIDSKVKNCQSMSYLIHTIPNFTSFSLKLCVNALGFRDWKYTRTKIFTVLILAVTTNIPIKLQNQKKKVKRKNREAGERKKQTFVE